MLDRLLQALEIKGCLARGGKKKLAEISGYSAGGVSDFLSGKQPLGDKFIRAVCREFQISEVWVRTGEGEMFVGAKAEKDEPSQDGPAGLVVMEVKRVLGLLGPTATGYEVSANLMKILEAAEKAARKTEELPPPTPPSGQEPKR